MENCPLGVIGFLFTNRLVIPNVRTRGGKHSGFARGFWRRVPCCGIYLLPKRGLIFWKTRPAAGRRTLVSCAAPGDVVPKYGNIFHSHSGKGLERERSPQGERRSLKPTRFVLRGSWWPLRAASACSRRHARASPGAVITGRGVIKLRVILRTAVAGTCRVWAS